MTEWKLVPVEPTQEMIKAAYAFHQGINLPGYAYKAMLAAAPPPQVQQGEAVVKWPSLTSAQRSILKRLHLEGGHSQLHNATFRTFSALHDKGLVTVTIIDPTTGRVEITEKGKMMAKAIIKLTAPPSREEGLQETPRTKGDSLMILEPRALLAAKAAFHRTYTDPDGPLRGGIAAYLTELTGDAEVAAFLSAVARELARARKLFPGANLNGLAMMEEAGEVAKAMLDEPLDNIRKECVQLAAMAARIALEGDLSVNAYRNARDLPLLGGGRK